MTDFGEEFRSRILNDEAVDALLAELATGAGELIRDHTAAEKAVDGCSNESERLLEQSVTARREWPNPRGVVTSLRMDLAIDAERELHRTIREFAAWWADVAGYVVLATATGTPIDRARVGVAAPCEECEGVEAVFEEPGQVSELVGLAGWMAGAVFDSDARQRDLLATVKDLAARNGLVMRRSAKGELIVSEDSDDLGAEPCRRRLWGVVWADHRLPELPDVEQLENALITCGTPRPVVEDIRVAALAVAEVLAASVRLGELPTLAEQCRERAPLEINLTDAEFEALHDRCDQATDRLASYAETVTRHLGTIRSARRSVTT